MISVINISVLVFMLVQLFYKTLFIFRDSFKKSQQLLFATFKYIKEMEGEKKKGENYRWRRNG